MKTIRDFGNFIFDILFPIYCLGCGSELENVEPEKRWICPGCLEKIKTREEQVCPVCEEFGEGGRTHFRCRKKTALDGLWVATHYDFKVVSDAIHKLKFNFIRDISFPLSQIIIKSILEEGEYGDFQDLVMTGFSKDDEAETYIDEEKNKKAKTIIIPVPLHKRRYNWRGFNQSFLLSERVAARFGLDICEDSLIRNKNTKPQTQIKSMEERRNNIKGAFSCLDREDIKNKNVILVDDVCTTLATLDECAKELKKAGAGSIWALVVARR